MAKVILSAALGTAAKSVGGITFTTGPFGAQIGAKMTPVNSQSAAQLGIRANFKTLSKRWANILTATQQAGWIALAAAHQVHDSLGQLITLTGIQFYIKLNGALKACGQPFNDTAPGALSAGNPGPITIAAHHTGPPTLTVNPTNAPGANDTPVVWSIHPVTIGKKAILKHMVIVQVFAPATAGPYDILTNWNLKWGIIQTSQVIACKLQYTDSTTGWQGTATLNSAIAT